MSNLTVCFKFTSQQNTIFSIILPDSVFGCVCVPTVISVDGLTCMHSTLNSDGEEND